MKADNSGSFGFVARILIVFCMALVAFSACQQPDGANNTNDFIQVTDITGVPTTATVGIPLTLTATVSPASATNQEITWSIKDKGTTGASITGNKKHSTAAGTVIVTATITHGLAQGSHYTKDFTITVTHAFVEVSDITGVPTAAIMGVPLSLTGTVSPSNATNKIITWSVKTAGTTGASISGTTLTTTGSGTATVTATIANGTSVGTSFTKDYTITVNVAFVAVSDITNIPNTITVGDPLILNGTVLPSNATNQGIKWSINGAGTTGGAINGNSLTTTGTGVVTVMATIANGLAQGTPYAKNFYITVNPVTVTGVTLNKTNVNLTVGGSETLIATVVPENVANKEIHWTSDNTAVATVNNGTVTAVASGITTITVTTVDGNKKATCIVTVNTNVVTFNVDPVQTQTYTGSSITPTVTVRDGTMVLTLDTDYTVVYSNNVNVGTATVTVNGLGNYLGSTGSMTFTISPKAVTANGITVNAISAETYNGNAHTPTVTIKDGSTVLAINDDYSVGYANNTNAGTATITITGKGNYAGTRTVNFTISPKQFTVDPIPAQTYTGSIIRPDVTVRDGTTILTLNTDYTIEYAGINAGNGNAIVRGIGNYASSATNNYFTINPKVITFAILAISAQTYTGSALTPAVTVRDGLTTVLTLNTHYTATYSNNINAGTATVTITGIGNYAGSSTSRTFVINKATGATVDIPILNDKTLNSITINAVSVPGNGQTVEYQCNTTNYMYESSYAWQTGTTFSGLNGGTTYYIFARAVENSNYSAGAASSLTVTTLQTVSVEYYWVDEHDSLVTTSSGTSTLFVGEHLIITAQGTGYHVIQWDLNGVNTGQSGDAYIFSNTAVGRYIVGLFVEKDGKLYNTNITVTVR